MASESASTASIAATPITLCIIFTSFCFVSQPIPSNHGEWLVKRSIICHIASVYGSLVPSRGTILDQKETPGVSPVLEQEARLFTPRRQGDRRTLVASGLLASPRIGRRPGWRGAGPGGGGAAGRRPPQVAPGPPAPLSAGRRRNGGARRSAGRRPG